MEPDRPGSFRLSRRRALTVGGAAATTVLAATGLPELGDSTGPSQSSGGVRGPFERVHDLGITGEGVHVGVLDTTGFDPGHPSLDGAIETLRAFDDTSVVVDRTTHGTAAAAVCSELAPDARLSLASFREPSGFAAGVDWFRERGVDVVLAPVAAHGAAAAVESRVAHAAERAVDAGVSFVAPTGNVAEGHWRGPFGALPSGQGESARLRVRALDDDGGFAGRFVAWLVAHGSVDAEFNLALVRLTETGDGRNLIALSRPTEGRTGEKLVADVDPGEYVLGVRVNDAGAETAADELDTTTVEIATPTHRLSPARRAGSIAVPAAARGVLGVGAVGDDAVAPYSGRGPTADGRIGVDVVASPRPWVGNGLPGTSAAAARAAAATALVSAVVPDAPPRRVTTLLRESAGDVGPDGTDLASGWGRLAPLAAVQRARAEQG